MKTRLLFLLAMIFVVGCSTTRRNPEFYPNKKLEEVPVEEVKADTSSCVALADEYVKDPAKWKDGTKVVGESTVTGGAVGAATGAILSNAGQGLAAGAIGGVIFGLLEALKKSGQPDPNYEQFVGACLAEKGYRVYKWS